MGTNVQSVIEFKKEFIYTMLYLCLVRFSIIYSILFAYVLLAILWWGYALIRESDYLLKVNLERIDQQKIEHPNFDKEKATQIAFEENRKKHAQFYGEGAFNLLIVFILAFLAYFSYRRQIEITRIQKNFMLSITHELKTPIAGILLNIQTLIQRNLEKNQQLPLLKNVESEAKRLNDMSNNILVATQIEDGAKELLQGDCEMGAVVENVLDEFVISHPDRKCDVDLPSQKINVRGDENIWKIVLSNLLENASKYSQPNSLIQLTIKEKGKHFVVQIIDEGIGISEEDKIKVFQKFYRVGNENTRTTKGTGLGLYLVKKILNLLKYDIAVRNNVPKGSIFEIEIY